MRIPGVGIILNPGTSPIPAAQAWAVSDPVQSSFAGVDPFYGQPPTPASDTADCVYDIPDSQAILAAGTYLIPPGLFTLVCITAGLLLQLNVNGTWTTIFTTTTVATPITMVADGTNVRLNNTTGGTITATMYRIK